MARRKRTPQQTENIQEYRRLRRNILARMRYREKQGFKVDYTTKPPILERATKRDIEKLSRYKVGLNKYGEVIADKPRSKAFVRKDFKGVTPSSSYVKNDSTNVGYKKEKEVGLDYIGMIWGKLSVLLEKSNNISYDDIGHEVNDVVLNDLMDAYGRLYRECCDIMNENEMRRTEEQCNNYFKSRWAEISDLFAKICDFTPSNDQQLMEVGGQLKDILLVP